MGTYRLFPSIDRAVQPRSPTRAPSWPGSCSASPRNCWFEGYWWWVCPTGQSTSPQKFALWQVYGAAEGNVMPGSVVTSGTLTAGQWNYIPLPTPIQLSIGNVSGAGAAVYEVATGFSGSFPDTNSQFGAGEPLRLRHHERAAFRLLGSGRLGAVPGSPARSRAPSAPGAPTRR